MYLQHISYETDSVSSLFLSLSLSLSWALFPPRTSHPSFWGAVSSSVDFYEHTQTSSYVAEPANTLSSLIIVLLGLAGLGLDMRGKSVQRKGF